MTSRALDLIPDFVLGTLSDAERREVETQLEASPDLRAELAATIEAFAGLGDALKPVTPPPYLRGRLLHSITAPEERHAPFAVRLAKYFDHAVDRTHELLRSMYDPATEWEAGPIPGILLMHFSGGPRVATADVGFVRFPAGFRFPRHRHLGHEVNFVLEGTMIDSDARVFRPGDVLEMDAGSEHSFAFDAEQAGLIAVVVMEGFEILEPPG